MRLLILAGSDRKPGPVPTTLSADQMLSGLKGAHRLPWGRSLAAEVLERFRQSERFEDFLLVGPADVYRDLVDCEIVDVSGALFVTLRRVLTAITDRYDDDLPLAITTCDILPTPAEICELLDTAYEPHRGSCFWWQLVAASAAELTEGGWKPHYQIRRDAHSSPETVYPGHLVILRPEMVRLELMNQLLAVAYRYRNLSLGRRFLPLLLAGLRVLLGQDLANLGRGQFPLLTVSIPWHVLRTYFLLARGRLTLPDLERHTARVIVHRRYAQAREQAVVSLTRLVAFAKDIDTWGELQEAICRGPLDAE